MNILKKKKKPIDPPVVADKIDGAVDMIVTANISGAFLCRMHIFDTDLSKEEELAINIKDGDTIMLAVDDIPKHVLEKMSTRGHIDLNWRQIRGYLK